MKRRKWQSRFRRIKSCISFVLEFSSSVLDFGFYISTRHCARCTACVECCSLHKFKKILDWNDELQQIKGNTSQCSESQLSWSRETDKKKEHSEKNATKCLEKVNKSLLSFTPQRMPPLQLQNLSSLNLPTRKSQKELSVSGPF
jgi:hypothetical protein